ncbi:MAG: branched-chain amino acid ABC transporter permease, partial [Actinobacteria bacterium]|nr:branched-chain amino acid ABC transporter permease [Actinomycetota bacterium]
IEALASYRGAGGFQEAVPWILVLLVLLLRPRGLVPSPVSDR